MKLWGVAAALMLGCGLANSNEADRRLRDLHVEEQKSVLTRLLGRSGISCARVNRVFRQGRANDGSVVWNAACDNGEAYAILVAADSAGSTKVVTCRALKAVRAGECFKAL